MNPESFKVLPVVRPNRLEGLFDFGLVAGGAKSGLIADLLLQNMSFVGAIDNAFEIDLLRQKYGESQLQTFSLGEGHTTWSVHGDSEEGMREASYATANTDLGVGSGARIANAFREAELLVQSERFLAMLESLPEKVQVKTDSCLKYIVATFYYSTSGAVGAAIIPVVAPPILRALSKFGVVVNARFHALGPDTFAGVSRRARRTSASALASNVRMILDRSNKSQLKVPKTLEIHNLPPFQDDVRRRNELLLLDSMACQCIQMEQYRNMDTPNHANTNRLGTITARTVDFLLGVDRVVDVAGQAASSALTYVTRRFTGITPAMQLITNEEWLDESRESEREDIEGILDRIDVDDVPTLIDDLLKPPAEYYFQLKVSTRSQGEFLLEQLSSRFASTIRSAVEFKDRLKLLSTFQRKLQIEFDEIQGLEDQVSSAIDEAEENFIRQHRLVQDAHQSKRPRRMAKLMSIAAEIRQHSDRLFLLVAEKHAVTRATTVVTRELRIHNGQIDDIRTILDSHVPKGEFLAGESTVATVDFDREFSTLLNLSEMSVEEQINALCGMAASVTLSGLQRCVKAYDNRIKTIARRIVKGPYSIQSPGHGGRIQSSVTDKLIYVCPPMPKPYELELEEEIRELQPDAKVLFYDRLTFGVAVMRIRIQRFSRLREIFGNLVEADLIDAVRDPLARLNSPDNFKSLQELGIRIDGDHLVFADDDSSGLIEQ